MRALLCHCHLRLEVQDNLALLELVRQHFVREHLFIPPTDTQIKELLTHAYAYECVQVPVGDPVDEELVFEPF
jgi:hypothetical protein